MKPAPVDLPIIWRLCTWEPVILNWKDTSGNPIDLTDWIPVANTKDFSLNAIRVGDYTLGKTQISLTRAQTATLKMGVYQWMWYFINVDGTIPPPFLAGSVEVKQPVQFFTSGSTDSLTDPSTDPIENEFSLTS
jgi:hypothetical protein